MPKISARKCPKTGKLFETDKAYRVHIVGLRKHRNKKRPMEIARRLAAKRRAEYRTLIRAELDALNDMDELEKYFRENFGRIMIAHNGSDRPEVHALLHSLKMMEFDLRIKFYTSASNTHAAPRNGETNWGGRKDDVPRGYPGFSGHISYELNFNPEDAFERNGLCLDPSRGLGWAGVHTGGGGGRGGPGVFKYEYGVTLFLSDFDNLQKLYFKDKLAGRLDQW